MGAEESSSRRINFRLPTPPSGWCPVCPVKTSQRRLRRHWALLAPWGDLPTTQPTSLTPLCRHTIYCRTLASSADIRKTSANKMNLGRGGPKQVSGCGNYDVQSLAREPYLLFESGSVYSVFLFVSTYLDTDASPFAVSASEEKGGGQLRRLDQGRPTVALPAELGGFAEEAAVPQADVDGRRGSTMPNWAAASSSAGIFMSQCVAISHKSVYVRKEALVLNIGPQKLLGTYLKLCESRYGHPEHAVRPPCRGIECQVDPVSQDR
ncbi:hypothetical protein GGR56DRAFT_648991 [Xylariaceae sp. FL0804]|nr:hypothetical protein GGR56DRAFT_648991 [Xylariaceae sp. FL0804]